MPQITFSCPDCGGLLQSQFDATAEHTHCPNCQAERDIPAPEITEGYLQKCLVCPSKELFVRKDFPQRLGVTIVVIGFAISCYFWAHHQVIPTFAVLLLTALIDVVLYLTMGNVLECYSCHAQYRGMPGFDDYDQFDMEAYEKHRQQALRLKQAQEEREYQAAVRAAASATTSESGSSAN